jgi:hypothetical protein
MDSNGSNHDTRRRGKREKSPSAGDSPEGSAKKFKLGEHLETSFGELVYRIVSETEKTHPHLIKFTDDGSAFSVEGHYDELGKIMSKYFSRK